LREGGRGEPKHCEVFHSSLKGNSTTNRGGVP
jgi:hypothetical protein